MLKSAGFLESMHRMPGVRAGWCGRIPGLDVDCDRDAAMVRLKPHHQAWCDQWGGGGHPLWRAQQVHGNRVAVVPGAQTVVAPDGLPCVPGVDGLLTATPGVVLGIYVADCGPIWLADPQRRVIGLLHSGKKGTEQDILGVAVDMMGRRFGSKSGDLVVVLGPCIRPPAYEVDFAAAIADQAVRHGVGRFFDCGVDTASDLRANYSYRCEQGQTGRMLAVIKLETP